MPVQRGKANCKQQGAVQVAELNEEECDAKQGIAARVGIYTSFGPSIPVYTCIYTDTRIYGLNTYDD